MRFVIRRSSAGCYADVAHRPGHDTWISDGANLALRHSHGESPPASLEADGKPVGEEARPVARLLRRSPDGVDFVVLIEMVGASFGHPRIVNRLLDLQICAISQMADVNDGHQDLRVVTEIHPLVPFVDGLPPHDERSPRALGLDTEEPVDNCHRLTPLSRGLRKV